MNNNIGDITKDINNIGDTTKDINNIIVTGSRLLLYQKNTWLRTMYCLQIIWWKNRKSQWRSWSAAIPHGEDVVQAACD